MEDEFIKILGFRHDYKLKRNLGGKDGKSKNSLQPHQEEFEPVFANNGWMYHVYFQLKPPAGQAPNLLDLHVHDV